MIVKALGFPWVTTDPFLFCVYHQDAFPAGNDKLGPAASLAGRNIGQDFEGKDGWRMYHGQTIPGFPQHPHRGFETVTIMRQGYIDHSDSLGATARFGPGDVQWLTAGKGIVHCEMFPLLNPNRPNPLELFQIWLNLPSEDKLVEPHFAMLWSNNVPKRTDHDEEGRATEISITTPAPPKSWAARPSSQVAIWTVKIAPNAKWSMPSIEKGIVRTIYFFKGSSIQIDGQLIKKHCAVELDPINAVTFQNGPDETELLLLQGRPIGEPVAQYGPFVMNTRDEINQAFRDYQTTGFGGWPWPADDPVFPRNEGRFARHADGKIERMAAD